MTKRMLVTGAAGFVGHHVVDYLLRETDWDIVALVRMSKVGRLRRMAEVLEDLPDSPGERLEIVWHDLNSPINPATEKEIGDIDYVAHLAAETNVDTSIEDPIPFIQSNVLGTAHLLEWCRAHDPSKICLFSTDEVYGPILEGAFQEGAPYNSSNPYAATKAAQEQLGLSYVNTYGLPVFVTNTMNVFGERQDYRKLIPTVIRHISEGTTMPIFGDAAGTKPGSRFYIHASSVARALVFLFEVAVPGERYNIVGNREIDNLTLAQEVAGILDRPLNYEIVDFYKGRAGHDFRYALDGSKLKSMGWSPDMDDFDALLVKTVRWSIKHPEWTYP